MESKKFIIPKNCNAQFEIIQNIGWREFLFFLPSIIFDGVFLLYVPVPILFLKIFIMGLALLIPFFLVTFRPIRENIPAWKMILWEIQFQTRQKRYIYRKEIESDGHILKEKQ